jgi:hypothetical protein
MPRPAKEQILGDAELIQAVGEINVLWDEIEMYLWYIFDTLLDVNWRYSYGLFFMHPNHRVRREMLEKLIALSLSDDPKKQKILRNILARVKRAAKKRNDIAHGIWDKPAGPRSELRRMAVKPDHDKSPVYSKKDLLKIRDEISKLENDLFFISYPEWEKVRLPKYGWRKSD